MTRKDYCAFVNALAAGIVTGHVKQSFIDWLSRDNPAFDAAKFNAYLEKQIAFYEQQADSFVVEE
jgi:hypothetical protein